MRVRTKIGAGQIRAIRRAMLAAPNKSVFQRLQCLWLRTRDNLSTEAIARAAGLSVSHVRRIWSDYLRGGLARAQGRPRGGQSRRNLTPVQEREVLAPLEELVQTGQPVAVRDIQLRYEQLLGRPVPPVTVYRLLARHQWRRVRRHGRRRDSRKPAGQAIRGTGWAPRSFNPHSTFSRNTRPAAGADDYVAGERFPVTFGHSLAQQ